jgi:hypothetical protein
MQTKILAVSGGFYFFGTEVTAPEGYIALKNAAMFGGCVSTKKAEPLITHATVRVSDSEEWIDIECRMEDGQKGAFIQVDASFPQLAMAIAHYLTHEQENEMQTFRVFYRVPANEKHGTYLGEVLLSAHSREEAIAKVAAQHPEYTEVH